MRNPNLPNWTPGSVMDKLGGQVSQNIQKSGIHVWGIFGDTDGPTFAYTTGLAQLNRPEFLLVGFAPEQAHFIIMKAYQQLIKQDRAFADRETFFIDDDPNKVLVFLDARDSVKDDYTVQTGQYYGTETYDVQQIMLPDVMGRFPNDPECEYFLQPILAREPLSATTLAGLKN